MPLERDLNWIVRLLNLFFFWAILYTVRHVGILILEPIVFFQAMHAFEYLTIKDTNSLEVKKMLIELNNNNIIDFFEF